MKLIKTFKNKCYEIKVYEKENPLGQQLILLYLQITREIIKNTMTQLQKMGDGVQN